MAVSHDRIPTMQERFRDLARMDKLLEDILAAIAKVESSQGIVSLPKAELNLLSHIEVARDFTMKIVANQSERCKLREIFGGDCSRIARLRAICENIKLSDMNRSDQRLNTCLRACESVEKVVVDLGDGEFLRMAQARIRAAMQDGSGLVDWAMATPMGNADGDALHVDSSACKVLPAHTKDYVPPDIMEHQSQLILSIVQAEAARCEEALHDNIARLEKRLADVEKRIAGLSEDVEQRHVQTADKMSNLGARLDRSHDCLHEALQRQRRDLNESRNYHEGCVAEMEQSLAWLCEHHRSVAAEFNQPQQKVAVADGMGKKLMRLSSDAENKFSELQLKLEHDVGRLQSEFSSEVAFVLAEVQAVRRELSTFTDCPWRVDIDSIWDSFANVGQLVAKLENRIDDLNPSTSSPDSARRKNTLGLFRVGADTCAAKDMNSIRQAKTGRQ